MTKHNRPGRPRKAPTPEGATLREAAAHFGVARKTVLRWLDQGMPSTLYNERRYIDLAAADEWKAGHDDLPEPIPVAPVLHPSDIRHRERSLASEIRRVKFGLDTGQIVRPEQVAREALTAFAALNARLNSIASMVGGKVLAADNAAALLTPVMESIAADFDLDADARWPEPRISIVPDSSEDEDLTEFDPQPAATFKPVLPASDPQAQFAAAKVAEHEAALDELRACVPHADTLEMMRTISSGVRRELARLPARVAKQLRPGDSFAYTDAVLAYTADATKAAIMKNVFKVAPEIELTKPKRDTEARGDTEDVDSDGSEFNEGVE